MKKIDFNKIDYRFIYIGYLIVIVIVTLLLNRIYKLSEGPKDTFSLIANASELLGLSVALTEIFILTRLTDKIRRSIESLQSYSDISNISIFLSQTKDDIIGSKYGKAILRLEKVRDVYQENLPPTELSDTTSNHRKNFDTLNSMISTLTLIEQGSSSISKKSLTEFVTFLTSFNETITSLKITFKNSIL